MRLAELVETWKEQEHSFQGSLKQGTLGNFSEAGRVVLKYVCGRSLRI
jgi:hypothetical protein